VFAVDWLLAQAAGEAEIPGSLTGSWRQ